MTGKLERMEAQTKSRNTISIREQTLISRPIWCSAGKVTPVGDVVAQALNTACRALKVASARESSR